eukprot:9581814-Lingulodinium_polyedra.AAC.1
MLAAASCSEERTPWRFTVRGDALLVADLMPDQVEACLEILDAQKWMRPATPPVRLSTCAARMADRADSGPHCEEIRFARPQVGHD